MGCGVIDNWTGVVIVANLYLNLRELDNQKTYKFIAFGKEEKGLVGSKVFVKRIPEQERKNYCAMVNLDSFGFTDLWALESISDGNLIKFVREVADQRKVPFAVINYERASSDSKSFMQKGIPAITLSGLDKNWRDYLHKEKDRIEYINFDKVFDNFRFAFQFITEIDRKPCEYFR